MSKSRPQTDSQRTIFEILQSLSQPTPTTEGQLRCADRLRAAMRSPIKGCPLSIHQIAGEMSHLLGSAITADQIYSWTRESDALNGRQARHIPFEFIPAFCHVTRSVEPLRVAAELVGHFVYAGPDAMRAEVQRLNEQIRGLQSEKRKREIFLKEIERR